MRFWFTAALLAVLLFVLSAVDFVALALSPPALSTPGWLLLASFLSAAALSWAVVSARGPKWRLVHAIFLVHYGGTFLMTAIEAVYLEELRGVIEPILLNGLVTAGAFAPATVLLHTRPDRCKVSDEPFPLTIRPGALVWKLPLLAILWMLLFVLAGSLVFLPVARSVAPELLAGYTDLPTWVLPFQGARAILWLLLTLPMLQALIGKRQRRALILGILFAVLMGSNLLLPNPLMPAGLQLAHLAEVTLANFAFGFAAGFLLPGKARGSPSRRDTARSWNSSPSA